MFKSLITDAPEAPLKLKEQVNHPKHYGGDTTYECIKVLRAWLTDDEYKGFLKGNVIKYLCRAGKKEQELQDVKKALWYLQELEKSMQM